MNFDWSHRFHLFIMCIDESECAGPFASLLWMCCRSLLQGLLTCFNGQYLLNYRLNAELSFVIHIYFVTDRTYPFIINSWHFLGRWYPTCQNINLIFLKILIPKLINCNFPLFLAEISGPVYQISDRTTKMDVKLIKAFI